MSKKKKSLEELLEEALVPEDEQPYCVPDNWIWSNAGAVSTTLRGVSYKKPQIEDEKGNNNLLIIRGGNIQDARLLNQADNVYVPKDLIKEEQKLRIGDVVIVSSTGSSKIIGKAAPVTSEFVGESFGAFLTTVRPSEKIDYRYFRLFYQTSYYRNVISHRAKGSNINNVKREHLDSLCFPLPPLDEQKRIAEKVERLLSKIDEAKQLIEEAKETFERRRAAILDKAFRGELTGKWREKKPSVTAASKYLLSLGIGTDKLDLNQVFDLPCNWSWVNLGELSNLITKGASPKWQGINYTDNKEDILFITSENIREGFIDLNKSKFVEKEFNLKQKRSILFQGDLLLNIVGASIGRAAIFEKDINANINQAVSLIRLKDLNLSKYIIFYLNSHISKGYYNSKKVDVARANLSLKDVASIPIPVPPLEELHVITRLIEDVEIKEKELNISLEINDKKTDILKQSILSNAFKGKLGTNDPSEARAIELLKEVLSEKLS